jgi:formiminoglutamase
MSHDPRIGALMGRKASSPEDARAVIIGFPSDRGVRINGGRSGAAGAPTVIRVALSHFTPDALSHDVFVELIERTVDLGDLIPGAALELDQEQLGEFLAPLLRAGTIPIVLGGGHETSFGHFLGYVYAGRDVSIVNWDAHPDVRPLIDDQPHSGSPFRQALIHLSKACRGYLVAGLQPHSTARAHLDFMTQHGARLIWRSELTPARVDEVYASLEGPCMVSFDLDAVDQAAAPGVSAPAAGGMPESLWLRAAYRAGRSPSVMSMDLVELNPRFDVDGRTARLAALTVWYFLLGLTHRGRDRDAPAPSI